MTVLQLLDAAGRRRSPATLPGFHRGRPPRNKGLQYPADPPTVEEIVAVMRRAGDRQHGLRSRALIVLLWRAGLRISEALSLAESDLDPSRGSVRVRCGKGRICCIRHMSPYVALEIMLRRGRGTCGQVEIGLVRATYFGRDEALEGTRTAGLVAPDAGVSDSAAQCGSSLRRLTSMLPPTDLLVESTDSWPSCSAPSRWKISPKICCAYAPPATTSPSTHAASQRELRVNAT
jgi:Phage integrase family